MGHLEPERYSSEEEYEKEGTSDNMLSLQEANVKMKMRAPVSSLLMESYGFVCGPYFFSGLLVPFFSVYPFDYPYEKASEEDLIQPTYKDVRKV